VTAAPDSALHFVWWTDGGKQVSTSSSDTFRTFSDYTDPISVIARLDRAIQYSTAGVYWIARSSRAMIANCVCQPKRSKMPIQSHHADRRFPKN